MLSIYIGKVVIVNSTTGVLIRILWLVLLIFECNALQYNMISIIIIYNK